MKVRPGRAGGTPPPRLPSPRALSSRAWPPMSDAHEAAKKKQRPHTAAAVWLFMRMFSRRRHVDVRRIFPRGEAEARIRPVVADQLDLVGGRTVEQRLPVGDRRLMDRIEAELPLRMREIDQRIDERVGGDDQPLAARH